VRVLAKWEGKHVHAIPEGVAASPHARPISGQLVCEFVCACRTPVPPSWLEFGSFFGLIFPSVLELLFSIIIDVVVSEVIQLNRLASPRLPSPHLSTYCCSLAGSTIDKTSFSSPLLTLLTIPCCPSGSLTLTLSTRPHNPSQQPTSLPLARYHFKIRPAAALARRGISNATCSRMHACMLPASVPCITPRPPRYTPAPNGAPALSTSTLPPISPGDQSQSVQHNHRATSRSDALPRHHSAPAIAAPPPPPRDSCVWHVCESALSHAYSQRPVIPHHLCISDACCAPSAATSVTRPSAIDRTLHCSAAILVLGICHRVQTHAC